VTITEKQKNNINAYLVKLGIAFSYFECWVQPHGVYDVIVRDHKGDFITSIHMTKVEVDL